MNRPDLSISVVVPVLDDATRLDALLQQLQSLDTALDIIVVDGGSRDNTAQVASTYPVTLLHTNAGRGNQLAVGCDAATGEVLWFVHVDSVLDPDSLAYIRDAIHGGARFGCFSISFHDATSTSMRVIAYLSNLRARWFGWLYGDQGVFCEAGFYDEIGGFSRHLPLMEDLAFSRKARQHTRPRVLEARIGSSARRFTTGGAWRTFWKMQCLKFAYLFGVSADTLRKHY